MARGKKTGGRKPGSTNKKTAAIKAALVQAFNDLGGVPSLVKWGDKNRTEFYRLWAKLLPTEVKLEGAVQVEQVTEVVVRSRQEADAVLALNNPR